MAVAQSFGVLNYSGMLFNKGNTRTPLSTMIGGRRMVTNHVEFAVGQYYTGGGSGSQPAISETASLTAPSPSSATRTQMTNVTQIFQESFGVSYAKMSNMGTLSGLNVASQTANPTSELDFQAAVKMQKIARDIEYTFINGAYNKATTDATINKTRGLVTAITTNVTAMSSAALGVWDVAEMAQKIYGQNAPTDGLVVWCDATTRMQLNADAAANNLTIVPASREVNGLNLSSIATPFGMVYIYTGECLPSGTALLLNLDVIKPVEQLVPGKGNFFMEELSKAGAGTTYQIFGQIGLDHGPEWYHGKWTGLATTFTKPAGKSIYVANAADIGA